MTELIIYIKDGGSIENADAFFSVIRTLPKGRYKFVITKDGKRTTAQNAYFHGVMLPYILKGLQDAGYEEMETIEDAKEVVKSIFFKKVIRRKDDIIPITIYQNTSGVSEDVMSSRIDKIKKWAAEYLGVVIPYPEKI